MHLFGLPFVFEYSLKVVDMSCFLTLGLQHCQLVLKSPSTNKRKEHCANSTTVTHPQLFEKLRGNEENIKFWISVCGTISADSLPKNKIRLNEIWLLHGHFLYCQLECCHSSSGWCENLAQKLRLHSVLRAHLHHIYGDRVHRGNQPTSKIKQLCNIKLKDDSKWSVHSFIILMCMPMKGMNGFYKDEEENQVMPIFIWQYS